MQEETSRQRNVRETRERILEVSLAVLGRNPDAGMEDIAAAAGVVRRTVYGHFPSRAALVTTLVQKAMSQVVTVLLDAHQNNDTPERVWAGFVCSMWPLMKRYRALIALRRGYYSDEVHALLAPLEVGIRDIVAEGQEAGTFSRHLPADVLGEVAFAAIFALFEGSGDRYSLSGSAAAITTLLTLGVPAETAGSLVGETTASGCTPPAVAVSAPGNSSESEMASK